MPRKPNGQIARGRARYRLDSGEDGEKLDGQSEDLESGEVFMSKSPEVSLKEHLYSLIHSSWRLVQSMIGAKPEEIITVQEIIKGSQVSISALMMMLYAK